MKYYKTRRVEYQAVGQDHYTCIFYSSTVVWAKMYLYFAYAHKASWHTVAQTPDIERPITLYEVNVKPLRNSYCSLCQLNNLIT